MNKLKRTWTFFVLSFVFSFLIAVAVSSCGTPGSEAKENTEEVETALPSEDAEHPNDEGSEHPNDEGSEHPHDDDSDTTKSEHPSGEASE